MVCPKCGSESVSVQVTATEKSKPRHGVVYWVFFGWYAHMLLWLFLTLPMLIWRLIRPNRKSKTVTTSIAVCQGCGHHWAV
jgi:hypothetical protein